jgi:hypothetical protein
MPVRNYYYSLRGNTRGQFTAILGQRPEIRNIKKVAAK